MILQTVAGDNLEYLKIQTAQMHRQFCFVAHLKDKFTKFYEDSSNAADLVRSITFAQKTQISIN